MPIKINQPSIIQAAGTKPKRIEEYIGRVNSNTGAVSVARMVSPPGWQEPGQQPEFDEYTVVLKGMLRVESADGILGALWHAGTGRCRIHRRLPAGLLTGYGSSG
jgi:hypothetical protein